MKILKYLFFLLLIVIIGSLIYISTVPSEYDVKRSKVMKLPISALFNTVNDLKTGEKWGPWMEEDSTIVVSYGDKTVGVGASDSWTSRQGPGSMKIVAVEPNKSIHQKMQFGDNDPMDVYWTFDEVDGGTKVTWGMKAINSPFMFKAFAAISGGWEKMLGKMEIKGLDNLEKLVTEQQKIANSFKIGDVKIVDLPTQKFIGYFHKTKTNMKEFSQLFMNDMPKAGMYAMKNGLKHGDFTPASVYIKWDEKVGEAELYIGLLLKKDLKPAEGMTAINLAKGKTITVSKFGNYGTGDYDAHMAIDAYMKQHKLKMDFPIWELYVNDPMSVKPQNIQTDIFYPIK